MKIITALALTLSVFATTTSAAPAPVPGAGILDSLSEVAPLGNLEVFPFGNSDGTDDLPSSSKIDAYPSTEDATSPSTPSLLKKRGHGHINDILDLLVRINTNIVIKALVKLKVDLCADIHAKVNVRSSGLLSLDADVLVPKISAKVKAEVDVAIRTKVDLDAKVMVLDRIRDHGRHSISKYCSHGDDGCLRKHAKHIVDDVEALVKLDVEHLFVGLKTNLMAHVRAKVKVIVRELGVNLLLEKIHVQAYVDAVAQLDVHLKLCLDIIVKRLRVTVLARVLALIKSLLSSLT
ncbi:hypothetical protein BGX28_010105 [Mortierella sp. GBA30]|nr:hypothetical protein BGX28_010105 [Mortierella sp. GBA30]